MYYLSMGSPQASYIQSVIPDLALLGSDFDEKNDKGMPLLQMVIRQHFFDAAREMIHQGANIAAEDADGATALIHAIRCGADGVFKDLVARGANVDHQMHDGKTAIMFAVKNRHEYMCRLLLDADADVTIKDVHGKSAQDYLDKEIHWDHMPGLSLYFAQAAAAQMKAREAQRQYLQDGLPLQKEITAIRPRFKR